MSEYLDEINEADQELFVVTEQLRYLSNAFYQTGNDAIGFKLSRAADKIEEANKKIRGAVAKELNRSIKQAEESSVNVFKGVMAGIELGQNEDGVGDVSDTD